MGTMTSLVVSWVSINLEMENDMPAWSYSALTAFETCPRRYHQTRVAKAFHEPEGDALVLGNAAHKALELRAKDGTPIPPVVTAKGPSGTVSMNTDGWEHLVDSLTSRKGEVHTEQQIALDSRFCETGWFDKNVWVRGVVDIAVRNEHKVLAWDWKTGKRKPDSDQLKLFAALMFHKWPQVETIISGFVWLVPRQIDAQTYKRADLPAIWDSFLPRVKRFERAYSTDVWDAKPSGLCKNWCPVKSCEFCGAK